MDPDAAVPMMDEPESPDAIRDLEDAAQEVAAAAFDAARDVRAKAAEAAREATASLSTFAAGFSSWWGAPQGESADEPAEARAAGKGSWRSKHEGEGEEGLGDSEEVARDGGDEGVSWRTGGAAPKAAAGAGAEIGAGAGGSSRRGQAGAAAAAGLTSLLDGISEGFNDLLTGGSAMAAVSDAALGPETATVAKGAESEEEDSVLFQEPPRGGAASSAAAASDGAATGGSGSLHPLGSGALSGFAAGLSSIGAGAWGRLGELAREANAEGGARSGPADREGASSVGLRSSGRLRLPTLFAGGAEPAQGSAGRAGSVPGSALESVRLPASTLALAGPGMPEAPPEHPTDEAVLESFACSLVRRFVCAPSPTVGGMGADGNGTALSKPPSGDARAETPSSPSPGPDSLVLATPGTLHITSERVLFCARRGFPRGGGDDPAASDASPSAPRSPSAGPPVSPGEAAEARAGIAALFAHLGRHFPAVTHVLQLPEAANPSAPLVELAASRVAAACLDDKALSGPCIRVRAKGAGKRSDAENELVFGEFASDEARNEALALLENAAFEQ